MARAQSFFRTGNPTLSNSVFENQVGAYDGNVMTIQGTINKTLMLLGLLFISAMASWYYVLSTQNFSVVYPAAIGLSIGGLVIAIVISFKPTLAKTLVPVYAIVEGLWMGIISLLFESMYPCIVIQAVILTFTIALSMLLLYKTGMIKATAKFKKGVIAATGGIFLTYLLTFILGFFGVRIPFIHGSGPIGILFSLAVTVIAALNLVLDFDFIERGAEMGAPKYMEWYGSFGLLVTLIWLYITILRLLSKLRKR